MADSVHTKVYNAIDALAALALPPQHTNYGIQDTKGKSITFVLVLSHMRAIGIMTEHWSNSMKGGADLLDNEQAGQLCGWLQQKLDTFQQKLAHKEVLYFDILVHGLVRSVTFGSLQIMLTEISCSCRLTSFMFAKTWKSVFRSGQKTNTSQEGRRHSCFTNGRGTA
jgi:hypothetical protein